MLLNSGCLEIINTSGDGSEADTAQQERLVPRTEDLPIYSVAELNDKVCTS